MAHPEFQVSNGKDHKFYLNLTAKNGCKFQFNYIPLFQLKSNTLYKYI
jgi:hypothetical protein